MSAATAGNGRLRLAALPARTACTSTVATPFRPTTTAFATMVSLCGVQQRVTSMSCWLAGMFAKRVSMFCKHAGKFYKYTGTFQKHPSQFRKYTDKIRKHEGEFFYSKRL